MLTLEITIPIASKWPSSEEFAARNAVERAVKAARIGICSGAGGGMGQMDLTYRVFDESAARAAIAEAMNLHLPAFQYRVEVLP